LYCVKKQNCSTKEEKRRFFVVTMKYSKRYFLLS